VRLLPRFPAPDQLLPERLPSPAESRFSRLGADRLPGRPSGAWMPRGRHRSEAVDVDTGQLVYPSLKDSAVVMRLDEFAPDGGRATSGRHRWRLEWFAEVCENLPDRSRPGDERNQPDVAAAVRALERKLLPHPDQEFRPGNPGGVVRPGLLISAQTLRDTDAGASAAAGRDRRGGPKTQTARVRRRHWPPAAWTCGRGRARPRWRPCAWATRSGCGRSGRLGRGSRKVAPGRRGAGHSISASVREADDRHALGAVRV
jgi:hypothetical protein